jgi:hypothetical protein
MTHSQVGEVEKKKPRQRSFFETLLSCALYFSWGLAIFVIPFYAPISTVVRIPFFVGGALFLYVGIVTLAIRLMQYGAGPSEWDRKGLITVSSLWSWGLFLAIGAAYFQVDGIWRAGFLIGGLLLIVIGLAGSLHQLGKRERKGTHWYWLPGQAWLILAFLIHTVKTKGTMAPLYELVIAVCVAFCFVAGISFFLAVLPYDLPASTGQSHRRMAGFRPLFSLRSGASEPVRPLYPRADATKVAYRVLIMICVVSVLGILSGAFL